LAFTLTGESPCFIYEYLILFNYNNLHCGSDIAFNECPLFIRRQYQSGRKKRN